MVGQYESELPAQIQGVCTHGRRRTSSETWTVADCFDWADYCLDQLVKAHDDDEEFLFHFVDQFEGLDCSKAFSGVDSAGTASEVIRQTLEKRIQRTVARPANHFAIEWDTSRASRPPSWSAMRVC